MSQVHSDESYTKLKLSVSALDITRRFEQFKDIVAPETEFLVSDIFDVKGRAWDFIIASHVIEHVHEPLKFVRQLQSLAHDFVIIACPWNEFPLTTAQHVTTVTKELTRQMGARDLQIFTNYSWGKTREVCLFWLPGANVKKTAS